MPRAGPWMPMAACIRSDRRRPFPLRRTGRVGTSHAAWWRGPAATAPEVGYLTATAGYIPFEGGRASPPVRFGSAWRVPRALGGRSLVVVCVVGLYLDDYV